MNNSILEICAGIFVAYYVIGVLVILAKTGANETGAGGYCSGILLWALVWPLIIGQ